MPSGEPFAGLLLAARGRTRLTQRALAASAQVSLRAVQAWEAGVNYPRAERLRTLVGALLEGGGLTQGHERAEAESLWAAVLRESPYMRTPFDTAWFDRLLSRAVTPASANLPTSRTVGGSAATRERREDWGDAPDTVDFVGRRNELAMQRRWILEDHCRLVAVLGIGGIGKTNLAARLVQDVAPGFERVYWRSLRDAPPFSEWLAGAIRFLADDPVISPATDSEQVSVLFQLLRSRACLLVLDNYESVIEPGRSEGTYRLGLEGYARLLQRIGDASHQSCLVLTSREAPKELALVDSAARTIVLEGLGVDDAQMLLAPKQLSGSTPQWMALNERFGGNGLALKVVGESIREVFGGEIGAFLELEATVASTVFGGTRQVLAEQIARGSAVEQRVLRLLAVEREPMSIGKLVAELGPAAGSGAVLEAIEALRRRSLVERTEAGVATGFTLQSVVLEFVTNRLVDAVVDEIEREQPVLIAQQSLIKALAKDEIRQTQERLIGSPIVERLKARDDLARTRQRLLRLLDGWRGRPPGEQAYGPGNVINLLRLLMGDLRGVDLSQLAIRQAYLAEVDVQGASLVNAHLTDMALAEAFDFPGSVALSGDGARLAIGTSTGQLLLWRLADRSLQWSVQGPTGVVWGVALTADGRMLASSDAHGSASLWDTDSGRLVAALDGNTGGVWGIAVSADGRLVAVGAGDGTVLLWDTDAGRPLATLRAHTGLVYAVALSADGQLLASGAQDGTVCLWDGRSERPLATLGGHVGTVYSAALSADGRLLASGGEDGTVRLWDTRSRQPLATLQGHAGMVYRVSVSADGELVASAGTDGTVRLWDTRTGRPLAIVQAHTGAVSGVALSADGRLLASGGGDGAARLWDVSTGRRQVTLQGQTGGVWSVALSADGQRVASGGTDGTVRIWETRDGQPSAVLRGHVGAVFGVALSADGHLLTSAGGDATVRLWEAASPSGWRSLASLPGHTGAVRAVATSPDGAWLASGGTDGSVRLWEATGGRTLATLTDHAGAVFGVALTADGRLLASGGADGFVRLWESATTPMEWRKSATLRGHGGAVRGVAFSADGRLLASGGTDGTVRLWDTRSARQLAALAGQVGGVWSVALSADGHLLVAGGTDGTVRLWESEFEKAHGDWQLVATLQDHVAGVWSVALDGEGQLAASGSFDGTVKLWDVRTRACLRTLSAERRYEQLDITGLTGVTSAQRASLLALGAVDHLG